MPAVHAERLRTGALLESRAGDVQDIEFTIECGRLWMLQARRAKRSARAAAEFSVQLCGEGLIDIVQAEAGLQTSQLDLRQALPDQAGGDLARVRWLRRGDECADRIAARP